MTRYRQPRISLSKLEQGLEANTLDKAAAIWAKALGLKFESQGKEREEEREILNTLDKDIALLRQKVVEQNYTEGVQDYNAEKPVSSEWQYLTHLTISRDQTAASDFESLQLLALQANQGATVSKDIEISRDEYEALLNNSIFFPNDPDWDLDSTASFNSPVRNSFEAVGIEVCKPSSKGRGLPINYVPSLGNVNDLGTCRFYWGGLMITSVLTKHLHLNIHSTGTIILKATPLGRAHRPRSLCYP